LKTDRGKTVKRRTGEVLSQAAAEKAESVTNHLEGREIFDAVRPNPKNNHLPKLLQFWQTY